MYMEPDKIIEAVQGAVEAKIAANAYLDAMIRLNDEEIAMIERHKLERMARAARNLEFYEAEANERGQILAHRSMAYAGLKGLLAGREVDKITFEAPQPVEWEETPQPKKASRTRRFFSWIWRRIW